jgi:hypothetical protein
MRAMLYRDSLPCHLGPRFALVLLQDAMNGRSFATLDRCPIYESSLITVLSGMRFSADLFTSPTNPSLSPITTTARPVISAAKMMENSVVETTAIKLEFENGLVRMYVDGVLRLETRHRSSDVPVSTLETDSHLKRWADYLQKTNSDDSAARFFGKSALEADGFKQGKDRVWRRD